eukprot:scaffold914_cov103-Skeletonema_dohrnii-CCMP3373.AAC.6
MAQVGYWFARSQSAGGAQSSVKLGGGRFSDQPAVLARTIPKYTPRAENTVRTNRLLFGVPTALRGQLHAVTRLSNSTMLIWKL